MDSAAINQFYQEHYIPTSPSRSEQEVPKVVPSLIMQDKTTDTTHHLNCGCCPGACIHQNSWWGNNQEKVRPSLRPMRSSTSVHSFNDNSD